ncbi:hypothetical protein EIP86_002049 [Pleurotus ostreatoroseus]|nr:hypothetical protein EIP86_002049 [Pleurotus ostreatoroseus]
MWCAGATLSELFTRLRFIPSFQDGDEDDDGPIAGENSPGSSQAPYRIPEGVKLGITPGRWERDALFDARNGTLGLVWSIFQTFGSPNEKNWPQCVA